MTADMYTYIFLGVVVLLVALYFYGRYKHKDTYQYIDKGRPVAVAIFMLAKAVAAATSGEQFDVVSKIADAAVAGATYAEKLWLDGEIPKEDRERYAKDFIINALITSGIDVSDTTMKVVQSVVTLVCALLPHGLVPAVKPIPDIA